MVTYNAIPEEHLELDWTMFGELCRALALKVARDYAPEVIIGIARAGVIPGAVMASILRVDFYSMNISRRHGDEVRERPEIRGPKNRPSARRLPTQPRKRRDEPQAHRPLAEPAPEEPLDLGDPSLIDDLP